MLKQGLVLLSQQNSDAPDLPAVGSVSKGDSWDDGGFTIGQEAASHGRLWIDRVYFTGKPSVDWLVEKVNRSLGAGAVVQVGNEQNHPVEAWPGSAADWLDYQSDVITNCNDPTRCIAMPPSPGFADWQTWVDGSWASAIHCYGTCSQMQEIVNWYLANTTGNLYVTECNFGAGQEVDVAAWTANELKPFLDWLAGVPRAIAALYFAWRWDQSWQLPTSVDAAGGPVEDLLVSWTPPMNGGSGSGWYAAAQQRPIGTNYTPGRAGTVRAVVEHIAQGMGSPFGWFNTDRGSAGSSAHFWVSQAGLVEQYRPLSDTCWANGPVCKPDMTNPAVKEIINSGQDPNARTVAIEHEGYSGQPLTDPQIAASHDLTNWLCQQYGLHLGRDDVVGHYQIDNCNRAFCPGPAYPWDRIVAGTAPAPGPSFDIAAVRDQVWALAESCEANGWPWYGQGLKACTTLSKGER